MDPDATAFTLDVVGAGPAYTDRPGASGACYLLRADGTALVLDLGQGSFPRLAGLLEPSAISAVAISHLHPDHFIDLVPLRHYLRWEFRPARRVRVIGPAGLDGRLDALLAEPGFTSESLDVERLTAGTIAVGRFSVEVGRVTHTQDSYGFRVARPSGGPGLVYSGDCGRAEDLDELVRPGDTLLVEVSFGAGEIPPGAHHLNGQAVGALAQRVAAGRVLLTHIQMGHEEAATLDAVRDRYAGPVSFVQPGDAIVIGA